MASLNKNLLLLTKISGTQVYICKSFAIKECMTNKITLDAYGKASKMCEHSTP
jgi:hypothetical protein